MAEQPSQQLVICNGGTASPISLQEEFLTLTGSAIADLLFASGVGWFAAAASGLGYLAFNIFDLCRFDPPALPNVDGARFLQYAAATNGAQLLREDATAIIANIIWRTYCKCDNAVQPPPFVPPTAPPDAVTNPPGLDAYPTTGNCALHQWFNTMTIAADGTFSSPGVIGLPISTQPNWATFIHNTGVTGATNAYPLSLTLEWRSSSGGSIIGTETVSEAQSQPAATPYKDKFLVPSGTRDVTLSGSISHPVAGSLISNMTLYMFCTAAPPSAETPCCPPDPMLENLIIQVLKNEELILSLLGGSKTYARGFQHGPLTGEGTIDVSGLFGVQVEITQGVPTNPVLPGVPPYQFSVGWISMITADGMIDEVRITRQLQVWASRLAPYASTIGYHVNPGFTINIRELTPA